MTQTKPLEVLTEEMLNICENIFDSALGGFMKTIGYDKNVYDLIGAEAVFYLLTYTLKAYSDAFIESKDLANLELDISEQNLMTLHKELARFLDDVNQGMSESLSEEDKNKVVNLVYSADDDDSEPTIN